MRSKQFQGSKKKARKEAFLKREVKRKHTKETINNFNKSKSIEEAAEVLGIRLN